MNGLEVKKRLSYIMDVCGINQASLRRINRKYRNNYIRVINYHSTPASARSSLERQLLQYKRSFVNVDMKGFSRFMNKEESFVEKPGIMLTFDDGYEDNYAVAKELLKKHGFTGYFMVSSSLVGTDGYMTWDQIRQLVAEGHVIGSHTATHHRMRLEDDEAILHKEICESKEMLQKELDEDIRIFCWVGGEEEHYTKAAAKMIRDAGYQYAFMTNSWPTTSNTDPFQIERINVEADWSEALMRFQISGWMDRRLRRKRIRVEGLTKE